MGFNFQRCFFIKLSKNKGIETEIIIDKNWIKWFHFSFTADRHTDHSGIEFSIEIMRLIFNTKFYDFRHWDNENNCWETYKL